MKINRVCILGGTGFVGHHLVKRLFKDDINCRVLSRDPQRHADLSELQRVEVCSANLFDPTDLAAQFNECQAVINLVGILNESGRNSFQHIHVELTEQVIEACRKSGIERLLHMSALHANAEQGPSLYLRTKGQAEQLVHEQAASGLHVTSFRPSVIFGPDDSFFNRFAGLMRLLPGPFPLACPDARFAPVYVGDVVEAFARTLSDPATWGKGYDLCGPRVFTLRELVGYTAKQLGLKRPIIGLSDGISRLQSHIFGLLPGKPFSHDNYLSLQVDSVCTRNGLGELGITPTDVDSVVPGYLGKR